MVSVPATHFAGETLDKKYSSAGTRAPSSLPVVLIATVDPDIRGSLSSLLAAYPVKIVWAKSVKEVQSALGRGNVSACFCGFWLVEGTYRDVIRHLKSQAEEIPAIIACSPACPREYQDYLAALNICGFNFMNFPYSAGDLERVLRSAIPANEPSLQKHELKYRTGNDPRNPGSLRTAR